MYQFKETEGAVIAADTKDTLSALDQTILSKLRLCTSMVEVIQNSELPIGSSQKLLQSMASGLSHIVAGRGDLAVTVRQLRAIKQRSSLAESGYGCPDGWSTGSLTSDVEPELADVDMR